MELNGISDRDYDHKRYRPVTLTYYIYEKTLLLGRVPILPSKLLNHFSRYPASVCSRLDQKLSHS